MGDDDVFFGLIEVEYLVESRAFGNHIVFLCFFLCPVVERGLPVAENIFTSVVVVHIRSLDQSTILEKPFDALRNGARIPKKLPFHQEAFFKVSERYDALILMIREVDAISMR